MAHAITAEDLSQDLKQVPTTERQKFFVILATNAFRGDDMSHEQLFGHLAGDNSRPKKRANILRYRCQLFGSLSLAAN
jgi:hypothetical protein